jgi:4-amino-4-deoxy-L-arabinose transferase-like glycosyltransferase
MIRLAGALALFLVLRLGVRGVLPPWATGVLATVILVALVLRHRSLVIGAVLGLPALGVGGLIDPWETHYAEVAREMIERRDFISPWWANEGWFTSKPVLLFWLEAISMKLLGVRTGPDQMLAGGTHPEWAVRLPGFAFALAGGAILCDGVTRTCGRRAGLFTAIVLWTMPGFAFLSHQAMTDMPLIAGIAASLGLLLRARTTSDEELVSERWTHAIAALIAVATISQVILIAFQGRLVAGSPHACGLPSQPACAPVAFAHPQLKPFLQAAFWVPGIVWLLFRIVAERRAARLFAMLAWFCAALAAMAKGPAGLVIPAAAGLASLRSPKDLLRLEVPAGLVLAATMIAPWYVAVYARQGRMFLDELVMRHMLGRALDHLHDTNEGEDTGIVYFVRQLGYATFPWSGLALVAAFKPRRRTAYAIFFGAAVAGFTVVSVMQTKFHHYVLVIMPAIAALTGMWLARTKLRASELAAAAALTAFVGLDLFRTPARFILLMTYRYNRVWPSTAAFAIAFAMIGALVVIATFRPRFLAGLALAFSALLLDVYLPRCGSDGGQRDILTAYARDRSPDGAPLVAYQLNWKGENFYTGNNVAIFISSGSPMKTWLDRRPERTFYFATERARVRQLRNELGHVSSFTELAVSAEFSLVKVLR